MPLKTMYSKFINKTKTVLFFSLSILFSVNAQEIIEEKDEAKAVIKTLDFSKRVKVDGVAGVVGDFVVLDSDISKEFLQLRAAGVSTKDITTCMMFGRLLERKLLIHHSIQDSLVVNDVEVRAQVDQQINAFAQQIGSMEKLLEYYKKDTEQELRDEMYEINKDNKRATLMQEKVIENIEVTPEEVRQFFNQNLAEDPPLIGTELKVAQIVVIPKPSEEEKQSVINRLKDIKIDVLENGSRFSVKAALYSEDTGSKSVGGKYTINRKRPQFVKEFREVAFSLEEGQISEPFETVFGYHIIYLEKIRGQEYDVRHILLRPEVSQKAINDSKIKLETVRNQIINNEITFADAALEVSDEEETKYEGGLLINPETQDYSFILTNMEPSLYAEIQDLKSSEISPVLQDQDRTNAIKFKILTVTDRVDEHEADFANDYIKIKNLALQDKQYKAVEKWQNEKIMETFVKINKDYRDCEFSSNWLKKEQK